MEELKVTWKMISQRHFEGECGGFTLTVKTKGFLGQIPYWWILKDGAVIDEAGAYMPTTSELSAKIQSEKILKEKHLNK